MGRKNKRKPVCKLKVPTWYRYTHPDEVEQGLMKGIGRPNVPVIIRSGDGVRVILGANDEDDSEAPDVLIERQANGWLIVLHPMGGSDDPAGYLYFLDGGQSYLMRDNQTSITVLPKGNESPYRMVPFEVDRDE